MQAPKPMVYIVDDDPSIRESLSLLLQSAGYAVQTFPSAKEFLDTACDLQRPACLVSDVKMPGISGLDLQDELAATAYHIPMIFITGHGDIPMSVSAIKKGAVEFLPKPFEDSVLLAAVEEALAKGEKIELYAHPLYRSITKWHSKDLSPKSMMMKKAWIDV